MRKFRGEINGVEYTDQQEFEKSYIEFCRNAGPTDPVTVSFSIEEIEDEEKQLNEEPEKQQTETNIRKALREHSGTDDNDTDNRRLCSTADAIRNVVDETATRLESFIGASADEQDYRSVHELENIVDSALMKIDWLVQSLPANLRKLLCSSIYGATEEMVDKINSGLVDSRYEIAKEQELISDEIQEFNEEIDSIDVQIRNLDSEKDKIYCEINNRQEEYNLNESKINSIGVAKKFFDGLLNAFSM